MTKKRYVVRVVLPDGINSLTDELRSLLEQFRYAGLITVHREDEQGMCFDMKCPHGIVDKVWAEQNAKRMQSFWYNAVVAPSTD